MIDRISKRGRQAEAAVNDERLLAAARAVFASDGYCAPVAAVAERAGIGVGSLYRRYPTKDALLADVCLRSMREMTAIATQSRGIPDPLERLETFVRRCVRARCGAFAGVAGMIPVTAEMVSAATASQRHVQDLISAAKRSGQAREDLTPIDVLRLIELFSRAPRSPTDVEHEAMEARLLSLALAGIRAGAGPPLPGPAPTLRRYGQRWAQSPLASAE